MAISGCALGGSALYRGGGCTQAPTTSQDVSSAIEVTGEDVSASSVCSFERALARHLRAITERDLPAYASTLNENTTLLLADGKLYAGKSAVLAFHREFFTDPDWTQDFEKVRQVVHDNVGLAFFRVVFRSRDETGNVTYESRFLLSLTFVREDGRWQLISDQVTKPS